MTGLVIAVPRGALLGEDVLAGDPDVGGPGLDVGRDVARAHGDDPHVLEQELAVVRADLGGVDSQAVEEVERPAHQGAARHREPQPVEAHRLSP